MFDDHVGCGAGAGGLACYVIRPRPATELQSDQPANTAITLSQNTHREKSGITGTFQHADGNSNTTGHQMSGLPLSYRRFHQKCLM